MELIYADQTEQLIRGFFVVQNEVGLGRNEEAYHAAYALWLAEQRLPVVSKPPLPLLLENREALVLFPDFVAWDQITIEMKSLPRLLGPAEDLQLFDYLRARGDRLGLLVNMGLDRVHVERRVYDPPATKLMEDWSHWANEITGKERDTGISIRHAVHTVYESHRTGYCLAVTEKLLICAMSMRGLRILGRPIAQAKYHQQVVHESSLDCFVVDDCIVLAVTAQFDNNGYGKSLGLSCLKTLGLKWGVAVNFGRTELQVTALRLGRP